MSSFVRPELQKALFDGVGKGASDKGHNMKAWHIVSHAMSSGDKSHMAALLTVVEEHPDMWPDGMRKGIRNLHRTMRINRRYRLRAPVPEQDVVFAPVDTYKIGDERRLVPRAQQEAALRPEGKHGGPERRYAARPGQGWSEEQRINYLYPHQRWPEYNII